MIFYEITYITFSVQYLIWNNCEGSEGGRQGMLNISTVNLTYYNSFGQIFHM